MAPKKPPPNILADSDWSARSKAISFRKLMHLERHPTKIDTFTSTSAAYPPTPTSRTYGGHVFAQAAWAASHTVAYGLHVHSMTGYFLLLGDTHYAFEYRVRRVRDGGVYALRQVEAYQNSPAALDGSAPIFVAYISFKRDERGKHRQGVKGQRRDFEHQELPHDWLDTQYGEVLQGKKRFEDWPVCQGMDGMWMKGGMSVDEWLNRGDAFPGLEMRKVSMNSYNLKAVAGGIDDGGEAARKCRALQLYRIVVDEEDVDSSSQTKSKQKKGADDLLNLHACAHLYASDRNSLFLAQRALGFEAYTGQIGSLSHTVNFHVPASELLMTDPRDKHKAKEFAQEAWVSSSGADRVCHNSRIWDSATGKVLASTVQDGMMRVHHNGKMDIIDADVVLRREAKL